MMMISFFFSFFFTSKFLYKKFSQIFVCGWWGAGKGVNEGEIKEIKKKSYFLRKRRTSFFIFLSQRFFTTFFIQKKHLTIMTAILFNSFFLGGLRVRIVVASISDDKDL